MSERSDYTPEFETSKMEARVREAYSNRPLIKPSTDTDGKRVLYLNFGQSILGIEEFNRLDANAVISIPPRQDLVNEVSVADQELYPELLKIGYRVLYPRLGLYSLSYLLGHMQREQRDTMERILNHEIAHASVASKLPGVSVRYGILFYETTPGCIIPSSPRMHAFIRITGQLTKEQYVDIFRGPSDPDKLDQFFVNKSGLL